MRDWILMEVAEEPNKGDPYWVDYKTGGEAWHSPDDVRVAKEKAEARRAAKE